ncbi:hybrid sensor histidine kinase/response regulator transcription factor [Pedobacter caeni]|uniref:histidine kinase n=1 Tax=Pedobacter caeni TaxID=288992 RepID=A0A1M4TFS8_9SPHI|nr:two-component regulator propeller domain-containing protein [Pedobacter caeni]SHE43379.1 Two component regulator propeller [Pedobacter caeni]
MKSYFCLVLILLSSLYSSAVNQPYLYYLGIENGLSNNAVTSIYQDKYGFLWFGTYEGLNRYDGYRFQVFRNKLDDKTSLIDNRIVCIQEDAHHNLIVGTKKGANLYDVATGKFSMIRFQHQKGFRNISYAINGLVRDKQDRVYLATDGQGLLEYGRDTDIALQIPYKNGSNQSNSYHVKSIKIDRHENIWLYIQEYGLCLYRPEKRQIIPVHDFAMDVQCIAPDDLGNIWIGNESGLYKYDIAAKKITPYNRQNGIQLNNKVMDLSVDKDHKLWISTDGGGIIIYDIPKERSAHLKSGKEPGMLTSSAVTTVFEDKDQRLWIGTLRGGINIIDKNKTRFKTINSTPFKASGLISNFILSFCEDQQGNVWVGTDGEGLSYWNRKSNHFTNYAHQPSNPNSLSNNNIAGIVRDEKSNLWMATYGGGVNRFNPATGNFQYYPCFNHQTQIIDKNAWSIYQDKFKNIWVGTCSDGGTYKLNMAGNKFELFDARLKNVISINEDKKGVLWMGTFSSLIRVDLKNKKHTFFNLNTAVRAIYEDKKGHFWIGTEGGGLLLFNRQTGAYKTWSRKDGLSGNSVLNILEDDAGCLWISTFSGLSRFTPSNGQFKNFHEVDGLQSNQFNYNAALKLSSGEFLFGGIKGFNLFRPEQIKPHAIEPRLLITDLETNNLPYEQDESFENKKSIFEVSKITLPYDKAVLSVGFAALEYSSPNKISYAYYLEGWDDTWNDPGINRTINYSKLPEGSYRLRIKSTNAEGKWLQNERILLIEVMPPWWRSYWAYALYAIGLSGSIYLYLNHQKRQTALRYQVELAHLKVEQEKELNEKKLGFFTNVSHEFRTPLTLIINPLKDLLNHNRQVDSKELTVVYRNASRLLSLVDQLLLFRKSDAENLKITKTDLVVFCKEVYFCFSQQAKSRKIQFSFSSSSEHIELYIDREKIEISLFNLISNAFKFSPDGSTIEMCIRETEEEVEIHITDTGNGISDEVGKKIFTRFYQATEKMQASKPGFGIGLYLVNKFVSQHFGKVSYSSTPGKGTDFLLKLLKGKAHFPGQLIHEHADEPPVFLEELIAGHTELPEKQVQQETSNDFSTDKPGILIVDDNEEIRHYIRQLFLPEYLVYEAESGEQGLAMVRANMPDLVITDVVMKELSGVELCTKIKEDPHLSHIPVILLTSSSSAEIKLKGIEGGADDHITKPFDRDMLLARVANLLKSRSTLQNYFYNEITLQSDNSKVSKENKEFLERCILITERHMNDPDFSIKILADEIGMSHSALYKKVKTISGKTINEFIRYIKLRRAAQLFINSEHNVNQVAFQSGFSDIKYFREQFHKLFGLRPSEYLKKYRKPFAKGYKLTR